MIIQFVMVTLATAAVSYTFTKSTLFEELRWKVQYYKSPVDGQRVRKETKLAQFVGCPYCVSHWVALFFVLLVDLRVLGTPNSASFSDLVLDYTVAVFAVVAASTAAGFVIHRAYNPPVTYYKEAP